jgi:hypothetical protein
MRFGPNQIQYCIYSALTASVWVSTQEVYSSEHRVCTVVNTRSAQFPIQKVYRQRNKEVQLCYEKHTRHLKKTGNSNVHTYVCTYVHMYADVSSTFSKNINDFVYCSD